MSDHSYVVGEKGFVTFCYFVLASYCSATKKVMFDKNLYVLGKFWFCSGGSHGSHC